MVRIGRLNHFIKNELIPDGFLALVKIVNGSPYTIWYGPMQDVPTILFKQADETHCSPATYDEIATKLAATGKGHTLQ